MGAVCPALHIFHVALPLTLPLTLTLTLTLTSKQKRHKAVVLLSRQPNKTLD